MTDDEIVELLRDKLTIQVFKVVGDRDYETGEVVYETEVNVFWNNQIISSASG